ncbi:MAG: hypothetical protein IT303_06260 [Dehalococcoidia bacterium]|nr:hypothetical protein [Dehalococcoidia bacterium]
MEPRRALGRSSDMGVFRAVMGVFCGAVVLLFAAGCSDGDDRRPAGSSTADASGTPAPAGSATPSPTSTTAWPTPTATWTPSPTPTPRPGCVPDAGTDHYPVQPGLENGQRCLTWLATDLGVRVRVEFRAPYSATELAPALEYAVPAGRGSFVLPPAEFPALPGGPGCTGERMPYLVALYEGPTLIGGIAHFDCSPQPVTPEGCIGPGDARSGIDLWSSRLVAGATGFLAPIPEGADERFPACLAWVDEETDETAYRIELTYPRSGEHFVYRLPPNSVTFIIPEADSTMGEPGTPEWLARKDFDIRVIAETPDGDEHAGGTSVQVM